MPYSRYYPGMCLEVLRRTSAGIGKMQSFWAFKAVVNLMLLLEMFATFLVHHRHSFPSPATGSKKQQLVGYQLRRVAETSGRWDAPSCAS
jgi:hypothetical protein